MEMGRCAFALFIDVLHTSLVYFQVLLNTWKRTVMNAQQLSGTGFLIFSSSLKREAGVDAFDERES